MNTIAILLTVHNRREKTLLCLKNLFGQEMPEGYGAEVYLTDDGCTDGTPEAVRAQYPQVHIVQGDGTLFWNRGMYKAWEEAAKDKDYDFYLWLNDDTFLYGHAIQTLLREAAEKDNQSVIVAPIRSQKDGSATYGGQKGGKLIVPDGSLQECDTFNGNCVLIPRHVFKKVGNLDWTFRHAIGDLDYGYRVKKAGLHNYVSSDYLGTCEKNPRLPAWARKEVPLNRRLKNLYSPLGYAEPIPFFHYEKKALGWAVAIKHFITIHIRVLFPRLWKN